MDAPAAWLVLGTVLGVLLVAAVTAVVLAARRRAAAPAEPEPGPTEPRVDDLADFLEHPPGTRAEPPAPAGWATLAAPPPPHPPPATAGSPGRASLPLAALCLAALTLVGLAAAVATRTGTQDAAPAASGTPEPTADPDRPRLEGRLGAGGLVLEQRLVGVTATYPEIRLRDDGSTTHVELRLPTWNCLSATAPADPEAAGCVPSLVEHAELSSPDLLVERDGERIRLQGRAATWLHPSGTPPEPSGHAYEFELAVTPGDGAGRPVTGSVRIGTGSAPLVEELSDLDAG